MVSAQHLRHAILGVGSNTPPRVSNIASALRLLSASKDLIVRSTGLLRETAPMYITEQGRFLNGALRVTTTLSPVELLKRCKEVESALGRLSPGSRGYVRNGPRCIDLDIILYGNTPAMDSSVRSKEPCLRIPHPRFEEREFVLAPLCDLMNDDFVVDGHDRSLGEMLRRIGKISEDRGSVVIPLPRDRVMRLDRSSVMGVLNVTPDSFSDGGRGLDRSYEKAVVSALQMIEEGCDIIDIGGESTRPGAKEVQVEEELRRIIPVIDALRKVSDIPISIDTRHSACARAAVQSGADIINDVSGGTFDDNMLPTAADLSVPIVLMHMRGTPETMQTMTEYRNVVGEVAESLRLLSERAEQHGIPKYMQILDPGIGFAKNFEGNLLLIRHLDKIQKACGNVPMLLGPSRKGFIGKITGEKVAEMRDFGTAAACVASAMSGNENGFSPSHIFRVHNVKGVKQALMVADALNKV